jgi:hypothetical protein
MDPSRSESAMQGDSSAAPVTVYITQTAHHVRIETVTPTTRAVDHYTLDADAALPAGTGRAHWAGNTLVINTLRNVNGMSVTTEQQWHASADGSELHVESVLEVQHGYSLAKAKNYGAGTDVFLRVRK